MHIYGEPVAETETAIEKEQRMLCAILQMDWTATRIGKRKDARTTLAPLVDEIRLKQDQLHDTAKVYLSGLFRSAAVHMFQRRKIPCLAAQKLSRMRAKRETAIAIGYAILDNKIVPMDFHEIRAMTRETLRELEAQSCPRFMMASPRPNRSPR